MRIKLKTESAQNTLPWLSARGYDGGFGEFADFDPETGEYIFTDAALASFRDFCELNPCGFLACNADPELFATLGRLYFTVHEANDLTQWITLDSLLSTDPETGERAKWPNFDQFWAVWIGDCSDFEEWKTMMGDTLSPAMHKYLTEDDLIADEQS